MPATSDSFEKKSIQVENGQSANILTIRQALGAAEIWKALEIPESKAAILVAGSTKPIVPRLKNRLIDLFSRGVAQAARECDALLIDEGTKDGVSEIVGTGAADRAQSTKLVGVLPAGKITEANGSPLTGLDVNHLQFVLDEQKRPAETMCRLAEAASQNKDWILTVLAGGETEGTAMDLALETVRRGWRLVVIEGSGGLSDEIVRLKKQIAAIERSTGNLWRRVLPFPSRNPLANLQETHPRLYEVISDGRIMIVGTSFDAIQLRNLIKGVFKHPPKESILWSAWQQFAEYDLNSSRHRQQWRRLKSIPLYLAVISTLLVLLYSAANVSTAAPSAEGAQGTANVLWVQGYSTFIGSLSGIRSNPIMDLLFRFTIVLLPITSSLILSMETRQKPGSKYILLRGAAESIKRGIYSFRVLENREGNTPDLLVPYNEQGLSAHMAKISKSLLESDVNEAAFMPYEGSIPPNMFGAEAYDDGFSPLDPETYVKIRIGDQLKFYTLRTNQYEKRIRRLRTLMLVFGGLGTFLAAVGAQYWLPLTAAIVSSATAYLEYQQLEQILTKYNLTRSSLENIRSNWLALPEAERSKNVQKLVRDVEATLEGEHQGWVQYVSHLKEESGKNEEKPSAPEG